LALAALQSDTFLVYIYDIYDGELKVELGVTICSLGWLFGLI